MCNLPLQSAHQTSHVQEAQTLLVRKALAGWIESGILQLSDNSLRLAGHPVPVTIPGGATYSSHIDKAAVSAMHTDSWQGETYVISTPYEAEDAVSDILHSCNAAAAAARLGTEAPGFPSPPERLNSGLSGAQAATVLGFDLEFKAVFQAGSPVSPPALVQIATPWAVYLFHLRSFVSSTQFRTDVGAVARALEV